MHKTEQGMTVVTKGLDATESGVRFVTEASQLGWVPGEFPTKVYFEDEKGDMTELLRTERVMDDGNEEMIALIYRDEARLIELHILND